MDALPNPQLEHVFGRSRIQMPSAPGVEVFREAAAPGQRRRYTKRFLVTSRGDLRAWAGREGRILARLAANGVRCIPALAGFDGEAGVVQTFDAGVTVEQWATLVPVERKGEIVPHVFADCAHWWALAHYTLRALESLHRAGAVHLGITPDNLCVPALPVDVDAGAPGATLGLQFARFAFIDFAFPLLATEALASPPPLVAETGYSYRSPRLLDALEAARGGELKPLNALDWRGDLYSLAAMLRHYRPTAPAALPYLGWTAERDQNAATLLAALDDAHDREAGVGWPHEALIEMCEAGMREPDLVDSLIQGFTLAPVAAVPVDFPQVLRTRSAASAAAGSAEEGVIAERGRRQASSREQTPTEVAPSPVIATDVDDAVGVPPNFEPPPVSRVPRRRPQARASIGLRAAAVVVALGLALAAHDRPQGERRSTASLARTTNAPPSVASDQAAKDAAVTGPRSATPGDETTPDKAARRDLPIDAATVQHAASVDGSANVRQPAPDAVPPIPSNAPRVADAANPVPHGAASSTAPSGPGGNAQRQDAAKAASAIKPVPPPPRPTPATSEDRMQAVVPAGALQDVAARTEREVARVLTVTARADGPRAEQRVVELARSMSSVNAGPHAPTQSPKLARSLNAQARAAWERQDVQRALALQQRAFRANPNDPEVAGNLAYFYLKMPPAKPALARQLALYALAARGRSFPAGRAQDWGTLAIASALDGREADAVKAMYVMSTVTRDPERACRAAQLAVKQYGPAMRAPARAMIARMKSRGIASRAPSCT